MSIRNHRVQKERKIFGDIKVYNITTVEQREQIRKLIEENSKIIQQDNRETTIDTEIQEIKIIRYLLKELTSFGNEVDEVLDDELIDIINNADGDLKSTILEIIEIVKEVSQDYMRNYINQVNMLHDTIVVQGESVEKIQDISQKLGLSIDQLIELGQDQNQLSELEKLLETENKKKKPMDHQKPKAKRGRKKKAEQITEELEKQVAEDEAKLIELQSKVNQDANI